MLNYRTGTRAPEHLSTTEPWSPDEQLAIRIIRDAIDRGINFLDNSWDYNEGVSEIRMGRALRDGYRHKAFLMTKIDGDQAFEAARTFRPMSAAQREALLAKTATAASRGQYELFKTTSIFDATATNPDWLGEEPQRIQRAVPQ